MQDKAFREIFVDKYSHQINPKFPQLGSKNRSTALQTQEMNVAIEIHFGEEMTIHESLVLSARKKSLS